MTRDAMRVLHVVAPAAVGGLERVVQTLSVTQRAAGDDVHLAVIPVENGGSEERFLAPLRAVDVPAYVCAVPRHGYFQERAAIAALCERLRPDIVHTHGYRPDVVDGGVGRRYGAAVVTTVHGFTGGGFKNMVYEHLQRAVLRRRDAVVAESRPLARQLADSGVPLERLHVVRNACEPPPLVARVHARATLGLPSAGFVIGWVGRLSHEKGLDVLLVALAGLRDLPVTLAVLGDGPARAGLTALAEGAGVADRIHWCGVVPDAARVFSAFDALALSSRTEGTPIVLLEAMAAGVPVVATAVGGVPDVLPLDGGLLVPPEAPAALAVALRSLFDEPEAAAARALVARARVERELAVRPWADRYRDVYHAALALRAASA